MFIGRKLLERIDEKALAWAIDAAWLRPEAAPETLEPYLAECASVAVKGVCVRSDKLAEARQLINRANWELDLIGVVDFPEGTSDIEVKAAEARQLIQSGADELDAVISVDALRRGDTAYLLEELTALRDAAGERVLKVIIECPLLNEEQKILAAELCLDTGVDFVKTATGFNPYPFKKPRKRLLAHFRDVLLLRGVVGSQLDVKAAGGIRSLYDATALLEAGANRLGVSQPAILIEEYNRLKRGN